MTRDFNVCDSTRGRELLSPLAGWVASRWGRFPLRSPAPAGFFFTPAADLNSFRLSPVLFESKALQTWDGQARKRSVIRAGASPVCPAFFGNSGEGSHGATEQRRRPEATNAEGRGAASRGAAEADDDYQQLRGERQHVPPRKRQREEVTNAN